MKRRSLVQPQAKGQMRERACNGDDTARVVQAERMRSSKENRRTTTRTTTRRRSLDGWVEDSGSCKTAGRSRRRQQRGGLKMSGISGR